MKYFYRSTVALLLHSAHATPSEPQREFTQSARPDLSSCDAVLRPKSHVQGISLRQFWVRWMSPNSSINRGDSYMQVRTILFLFLGTSFLALSAQAQTRQLGSVTNVQNVACPSGFTAGS